MTEPTRMGLGAQREFQMALNVLFDPKTQESLVGLLAFKRVPKMPAHTADVEDMLKKWKRGETLPPSMTTRPNDGDKATGPAPIELWIEARRERNEALGEAQRRLRALFWVHNVFVKHDASELRDRVAKFLQSQWGYYVPASGLSGVDELGNCIIEQTIAEILARQDEPRRAAA